MNLKEVRKFLEELNQKNIAFDPHFYKRVGERPISESMVRKFLSGLTRLEKIEQGRGERFKLWFKMSRKYSLVLIVEINSSKDLKIMSAWNTRNKWQKKLKQ
tara:strand:- start:1107 stop:1412 length:306 start_codon:yes stop_codon:yes gene_type:complete